MAWLMDFKTDLFAHSLQHVVSMRFNFIVNQYFVPRWWSTCEN